MPWEDINCEDSAQTEHSIRWILWLRSSCAMQIEFISHTYHPRNAKKWSGRRLASSEEESPFRVTRWTSSNGHLKTGSRRFSGRCARFQCAHNGWTNWIYSITFDWKLNRIATHFPSSFPYHYSQPLRANHSAAVTAHCDKNLIDYEDRLEMYALTACLRENAPRLHLDCIGLNAKRNALVACGQIMCSVPHSLSNALGEMKCRNAYVRGAKKAVERDGKITFNWIGLRICWGAQPQTNDEKKTLPM